MSHHDDAVMGLHADIMNLCPNLPDDLEPTERLHWKLGHKQARHQAAELALKVDGELARVTEERDEAIQMLAEWCVDVYRNGTGWDDWDENYKNAKYRPGNLRKLLDVAIAEEVAVRDAD